MKLYGEQIWLVTEKSNKLASFYVVRLLAFSYAHCHSNIIINVGGQTSVCAKEGLNIEAFINHSHTLCAALLWRLHGRLSR